MRRNRPRRADTALGCGTGHTLRHAGDRSGDVVQPSLGTAVASGSLQRADTTSDAYRHAASVCTATHIGVARHLGSW